MATWNRYLQSRNTYHWDKKAYAEGFATNDYTKARIHHFAHDYVVNAASGILESFKLPLENRIWFNYPGQALSTVPGTSDLPSKIGRVLDDGTTQLQEIERNELGAVTRTVDPAGRTLNFSYGTNEVDLIEVRQTRANNNELLGRATYDLRHLPLTITDASGQTIRFGYNARGQLLSVTNARNESVTFEYDPSGYLLAIDGPLPGSQDRNTFTYDAAGRVRTVTDPDGYTLTFDYDALDRLLKTTFPDSTSQQTTYDRLKPGIIRDRLGHETHYTYNNLRQITSMEDALRRLTRFDWCKCGDLKTLIDPLGRTTTLRHDIQGRLTAKEYADGSKVSFDFENATGRLRQIRDEQNQLTQFFYYTDNTLKEKRYVNALLPTRSVGFTYDPDYPRPLTMHDGNGSTSFSYHLAGSRGAGQLASIDGPWANDIITFTYDENGRLTTRAIDSVAIHRTFDAAGRLTQLTNVMGAFDLTWAGGSPRLGGVHYPNGQTTEYAYNPNLGDQLLQPITHRLPNNSILSEFTYLYNSAGAVTNWTQLQNGALTTWQTTYDAEQRLVGVALSQPGAAPGNYSYSYDADNNRTSETIDSLGREFSHNPLNQVTAISDNAIPTAGYEWDAAYRLAAINLGTHRTEFSYDGLDRRTRIVEKENGVAVDNRRYLWSGLQLCEERDSTGATVLKRFSTFGVSALAGSDLPSGSYFFTRDNLASVREMCDQAGNVRGRFRFTPYGERKLLSGDLEPGFGFTGHLLHLPSSLHLSPFRAYDARLARWISRDPLGESEDVNLYAYVRADPINFLDPLGEGGTRADGLVQNTTGYQQAKAGLDALDTAKSLQKIADNGVKASLEKGVQDMGENAMKEITPGALKQYEDGVTKMGNTAKESGTIYENAKQKSAGQINNGLTGQDQPCTPTAVPPAKVDPPKPGVIDRVMDFLFGSSTPRPPAQKDGPIPHTQTFNANDYARAAHSN